MNRFEPVNGTRWRVGSEKTDKITNLTQSRFELPMACLKIRKFTSNFLFQIGGETLGGFIGFANLPNQVHRKSVKKGFEFTLMVVGKTL